MPPSRQPKRFCSNAHRGAFHEACRRLGERLYAQGVVTLEQLRGDAGQAAPQNTAQEPLTATGAPEASPDQGDDHHE